MVDTAPAGTTGAVRFMQGIAVPEEGVNPAAFFQRTRRRITSEYSKAWPGFGGTDEVELKKSGIIAALEVQFVGTLTVTPGTGTVSSTWRWPHDFLQAAKFTANGQSNLINASGGKLKVREFMNKQHLSDRGVIQSINNVAVQHGTFSLDSESWGVGTAQTNIPAGSYDVELVWFIPVAEDEIDLHGAIFAQTSSTDLTLTLQWELQNNLFSLTGNGAVALSGTSRVTSVKYSIPLTNGNLTVPDLSTFHSLIQSTNSEVAVGANEYRAIGQGAGKTLLRLFWQTWNGSSPQAPLGVNDTNYGEVGYRYGSNETPDDWISTRQLRFYNEREYNCDIGANFGFRCVDFAASNAFRDAIDLGTTPDFRILDTIQSGVTLTSPKVEYVQETIFQAGQGA